MSVTIGKKHPHGSQPRTVYDHMSLLLGTVIRNESDALRVTKRGIPTADYVKFAHLACLWADAVAPASTMRRRLEQLAHAKARPPGYGKVRDKAIAERVPVPVLNEAESEKAVRYARVVAEATLLFGDRNSGLAWLSTPRDYLQDEKEIAPMALAATDTGARLVESMMRRTAYGML